MACVSAHSDPASEPVTMPAPAKQRASRAVDLRATEGHDEVAVAARVHPPARAGISAARPPFELADHPARRFRGPAADGRSGVETIDEIERGEVAVSEATADRRGEVGDVGEAHCGGAVARDVGTQRLQCAGDRVDHNPVFVRVLP